MPAMSIQPVSSTPKMEGTDNIGTTTSPVVPMDYINGFLTSLYPCFWRVLNVAIHYHVIVRI
jgi:hypothetical protein